VIEQYLGWIKQLESALREWSSVRVSGSFRSIVVAGMGGSGIVGDYVYALSSVYGKTPVVVVKTYSVPSFLSREDLVLVISYSGNTIETLRFAEEASEKSSSIVVVTSGGLLEEFGRRKGCTVLLVPKGLVPRTSLPSMLYRVLGFLDVSGYTVVQRSYAEEAYVFIRETIADIREESVKIAEFVHRNRGLLILAGHASHGPLLIRGKNEFNENSKIPVKVEIAPEWMHNDIVGWEKPYPGKYTVLSVVDPDDYTGLKLVEYMEGVYSEHGFPLYRVVLRGGSYLAKLLYGSLLLGLASAKLAELRGLDPLVTESIKKYKEASRTIYKC